MITVDLQNKKSGCVYLLEIVDFRQAFSSGLLKIGKAQNKIVTYL
jgi:hypothetical protein